MILNKKVQNDIIVVGFHLIANSKFTGTTHMYGNVGGARCDTLAQSHVLEGRSSCKVDINEHNNEMEDMQNMNEVT